MSEEEPLETENTTLGQVRQLQAAVAQLVKELLQPFTPKTEETEEEEE